MNKHSEVARYLADARARSGGNFRNADGAPAVPGKRYWGAAGASSGAASTAAVPMKQKTAMAKQQSRPYGIIITNASAAAVNSFDVLGAFTYLQNPPSGWAWNTAGSLVFQGSVTISSAIAGVTYQQLLAQSQQMPFSVGQTYITSTNAGQISIPFNVTAGDATGNSATAPVILLPSPYQFQSAILENYQSYQIDGFTKVTFAQILANSTVTVFWHPVETVNPARILAGESSQQVYADPEIGKQYLTLKSGN